MGQDAQQSSLPGQSPGSETPLEHTEEHPKASKWEIWKPRVMLGAAVLLPCLLETLDYTGVYLKGSLRSSR